MKKSFEDLINAVIPLLPISKKADVEDYVQCLMLFYEYIATSRKVTLGRRYKRSNCASKIHDDPAIGLQFLTELENLGLIRTPSVKGSNNKNYKFIEPTQLLVSLMVEHEPHQNTLRYPIVDGQKYPEHWEVRRRGEVTSVMGNEFCGAIGEMEFTVNTFILEVLERFPVYTDKDPEFISYYRMMETARKYRSRVFRFPYFYCTRGRVYVDSTVGFTPQGADHEKALCIPVGQAQPLTESGLEALREALHGYSEQDWCDSTMIAHARDPDAHRDEWMQADKPFCYLALAHLLSMYYDDPSQPLPAFIPLDGRCSGLQHWSAVLRSTAITSRLGMESSEAEDGLDMYEYVAEMMKKAVPSEQVELITRKLCKKPVMTFAYSATRMSSMDNVHDICGSENAWCPETESWKEVKKGLNRVESAKLGSLLFDVTNEVLQPMVEGVDWLKECVKIIMLKTEDSIVTFPSPDGFFCLQDCYKENNMKVTVADSKGKRHSITLQVPQLDMYGQKIPSINKAQSGIGPNFIHNLDATHLRMVARSLAEKGILGIWIHDSFATHVNYRETLYETIVEEFIKLYSENQLLKIKEWWETVYSIELPDPPSMGEWSVESLRNCPRFFE